MKVGEVNGGVLANHGEEVIFEPQINADARRFDGSE